MTNRADIVAEARSWLGVEWRHQGRNRLGIDCAGIASKTGSGLGLTTHDPRGYPRRPDGTFLKEFRRALHEKSVLEARPGDVLVFSQYSHPCHCGIMTERFGLPAVLHAHRTRGKVVEETLEQAESVVGRPLFCFEYPGVED